MSSQNFISPVELKLRSEEKDIVASGSAHTFGNENLEFEISNLRVIFDFISNSDAQKLEHEAIDSTTLKIKIFNFENPLGTGTNTPLPIGTINSRRLYLTFIVHSLSKESSKLVTYTFFLGENVDG